MDNYISGQHDKCITAYRTLFEVLGDMHYVGLAKSSEQLHDDFDRYQVWAANVGAAFCGSDYKRSLDYRLREAGPHKAAILKILVRIESLVEQLITALHDKDKPDRGSYSLSLSSQEEEREYTDDSEDSSWSLSSDEILDQQAPSLRTRHARPSALGFRLATSQSLEPASSDHDSSSKLGTLLRSLNFSITSLYKVPVRRPANTDQAHHLARRYHIDMSFFEPFDVGFVRDLFRDADERIILRLGRMITRRRQILRTRSLRNQDLQREAFNSTQRQPIPEAFNVIESRNEGYEEGRGGRDAPSTIGSSLKATTFKPAGPLYLGGLSYLEPAPSEAAESVSSIATTRTPQDLIIIPPRPLKENGMEKEDFECPFCCTLVHIKDARTWKKHVLYDLQPYTCTCINCDEPDLLLDDREAWYNHELQHLSEYQCGDDQHPSFEGVAPFITHMKEQHAFDEDSQLHPGVLKMFLKPRKEVRKLCPLCLDELKDVKPHLGRHLQRIALFALPRNHGEVDDNEAASQGSNVPAAAARRADIHYEHTEERSAASHNHSYPAIAQGSPTEAINKVGERVFCHTCQHEWDREPGELTCPRCERELVEISGSNDERDNISFDINKEWPSASEEAIASANIIPDSEPTTWEHIKPELYKSSLTHDQRDLKTSFQITSDGGMYGRFPAEHQQPLLNYSDEIRGFHQPPVLHPRRRQDITEYNVDTLFLSKTFEDTVARRLVGAVKIPTITYNSMDRVGTDPRWEIFSQFTEYLVKIFPRVHRALTLERVNEHGLLYTWRGSDSDLKPLLFMAHSDVVPIGESASLEWTHPPFSGHYDGEFIWGRGSEDDKSNLIAMLTAVDCLLECDFKPDRTLIVSVGFDEEGGAEQSYGARCLAERLLQVYGANGIEIIFDEGIAGIEDRFGTSFALPATAEKGYVDVIVNISIPDGHSSTPPDHTAIAFLAQIIRLIEDNPFKSQLVGQNPTLTYLRHAARLSKKMPEELRDAILNDPSSKKLLEYMDADRERRAMVRTSTAIDSIQGGDKAAAEVQTDGRLAKSLPESVSVVVNHRIAVQDSVQAVKDHYMQLLTVWAKRSNFKLHAFGPQDRRKSSFPPQSITDSGNLTLTALYELDPSPVSDSEDSRFRWLAGTIRGVFGDDVAVAPELLNGNTDTRYYWDLSEHIYRMSPWRASHDPRGTRMHTVDERMPVQGLMEMVKFYHEFIRIVDEMRAS